MSDNTLNLPNGALVNISLGSVTPLDGTTTTHTLDIALVDPAGTNFASVKVLSRTADNTISGSAPSYEIDTATLDADGNLVIFGQLTTSTVNADTNTLDPDPVFEDFVVTLTQSGTVVSEVVTVRDGREPVLGDLDRFSDVAFLEPGASAVFNSGIILEYENVSDIKGFFTIENASGTPSELLNIEGGFAFAHLTLDRTTNTYSVQVQQVARADPPTDATSFVAMETLADPISVPTPSFIAPYRLSGSGNDAMSIAQLADGNFAVAFAVISYPTAEQNIVQGEAGIWAAVVTPEGEIAQPLTKLPQEANVRTALVPNVFALEDGGFAITYDGFGNFGNREGTTLLHYSDLENLVSTQVLSAPNGLNSEEVFVSPDGAVIGLSSSSAFVGPALTVGPAVDPGTGGGTGSTGNTPPVLSDLAISGAEDNEITGQAQATDAENDMLTFALGGVLATSGTASITETGAVSYTPNAGFFGTDFFDITVSDGTNAPVSQRVNVTVTPRNDAPVAVDQGLMTSPGVQLQTRLIATDPDGDALTFSLAQGAANGTVRVEDGGLAVYTPNDGFTGSDSFEFRTFDGALSDTGTVFIDVVDSGPFTPAPAPTPSTAVPSTGSTSLSPGQSLTVTNATGLTAADLQIDPATGVVSFGGTQFSVSADLTENSFLVLPGANGTAELVLVDKLLGDGADLSEGTAIEAAAVNGLGPDSFFAGNGTRDFTITLDRSTSGFDNAIGVYQRQADGSITDVQILFENANTAGAGASATVRNIAAGAELEFFFIQNGALSAPFLSDNLTITAAGELINDGQQTGLTTYFSELALNSDGTEHFVSGVVDQGGSLRVGIEDLTGGGDMDYQDVMFTVAWSDDFV